MLAETSVLDEVAMLDEVAAEAARLADAQTQLAALDTALDSMEVEKGRSLREETTRGNR